MEMPSFSIAMALYAAYECSLYSFQNLGNVVDWMNDIQPDGNTASVSPVQEVNNQWVNSLTNSASSDYTKSVASGLSPVNPTMTPQKPNPICEEPFCSPSFWVTERKLCLFCGHRG